jgi:post-segregation antitoxin (ccd killing protein)
MRWTLLLLLLLSSCATQRQAEERVDKKIPKLYAPAIYAKRPFAPNRLVANPLQERSTIASRYTLPARSLVERESTILTRTVYLQDTVAMDSLHRELEIEGLANQALRKQLKNTEADRDYWQEKNRQKFWTLIAMGVFGFLYILFTLLASRVKES